MATNEIIQSTDETFQSDVIESDLPVLVDFWAEWCAPCRAIAPIFEELSTEFAGKVKFCKVDIDQNKQTPTNYSVRSIPTLIMFQNGQPAEQIIGLDPVNPKEKLAEVIQKFTA